MASWDRMHRDHQYTQRRLGDAVDGALTARQKARVARHVSECPECGPMLRGLIRVRSALRAMGEQRPVEGESVVPGVLERLRRDDDPGRRPPLPGRHA